jgi:hypothetical protein
MRAGRLGIPAPSPVAARACRVHGVRASMAAAKLKKNRMHGRQDVAARLKIVRGFTRLPYCDAA